MSGFAPFFVAIGLGLSLPHLRGLAYALLGAFAGFVGVIQVFLLYSVYDKGELNPNARVLFFVYVISGAISFLAGGLIGERIMGGTAPRKLTQPSSLALRLTRNPDVAVQATMVIKELAPILLTILNAVFVAKGLAK